MKFRTAGAGVFLAVLALGVARWWPGQTAAAPHEGVTLQPEGPRANPSDGLELNGKLGVHERVEVEGPTTETEVTAEPQSEMRERAMSVLNVHVTWRDGTPAEGVGVLLAVRNPLRYGHDDRWLTTSVDGVARFAGTFHGKCTVETDRGGRDSIEVSAGAEESITLSLGDSIDVQGVVRGGDGRPVSGATIVGVGWRRDWLGARALATSDELGEFRLRCVDGNRSLGALASGWAPSALFDLSTVDVDSLDGAPAQVVLELIEPGADIVGRVTDPEGQPIEGALVGVGSFEGFDEWFAEGHSRERPRPHVVETDAEGAYALKGVAAGSVPLSAWHRDWPIWRQVIDVAAPGRQRIDIMLTAGVRVHGTVTRADGTPAAAAVVLSLPAPFDDPYPNQGPTDTGSPFPHPRTRAGADGTFELGPLPLGALHLHASLGTSFLTEWTGEEPNYEGTFQETLEAAAPGRIAWNPVLSFGLVLSGRALFADGRPMRDVFVAAIDADDKHSAVTTDEKGQFHLSDLRPGPHRVTLQLPFDAPKAAAAAPLYDVVPPAQGLELRADYSPSPPEPKGKLRLRLVDEAGVGTSLGKGAIRTWIFGLEDPSWAPMGAQGDGWLERELRPGSYRVLFRAEMQVIQFGPTVEIRSGETTDLGEIQTLALGSAVLAVVRPSGSEGALEIRDMRRGYFERPEATLGPQESECTFADLPTGKALFQVTGDGLADETVEVEVPPGSEVRATIRMRPAVETAIECTLARPQGFRRLTLTVTDEEGRGLLSRARREMHVTSWPFAANVSLPVGTYRFELATSDGQRASETIVIETVDAGSAPELRVTPVRLHAR